MSGLGRDVHVHDLTQSFCQAASRVSFPYNFCSCHFAVVLHVCAVPLPALKGACLFHAVLYRQVVFILQVNRSTKSSHLEWFDLGATIQQLLILQASGLNQM